MKGGHKAVKHFFAFLALASLLAFAAACSSGAFKTTGSTAIGLPGGGKAIVTRPPEPVVPVPPKDEEQNPATPTAPVLYLSTNSAEGRQRKNVEQIKDAVLNCLGDGGSTSLLNVTENMLVLDFNLAVNKDKIQVLPEGRRRFLLENIYASNVGQSIVGAEEKYLQTAASRTGLASDDLEDEIYLKSLVIVASVAAFNCDVKDPNSNCYCATKTSAESMVKRCLPQFSPAAAEFKAAVEELYSPENCGAELTSEDGFIKRRRAISALLSSYSFATAK